MKHTPGPWAFSFESIDAEWSVITASGGVVIANVNADLRQAANTRLIAVAPDLLAALRAVLACACDDIKNATDADLENALDDDDKETRQQANAFLIARAAIAKAGAKP